MGNDLNKWAIRLGLTEEDLNPSPETIAQREKELKRERRRELLKEGMAIFVAIYSFVNMLQYMITKEIAYAIIEFVVAGVGVPLSVYLLRSKCDD